MTVRRGGNPRERSQAHPMAEREAPPWEAPATSRPWDEPAPRYGSLGRVNGGQGRGRGGGGLVRFLVFALVLAVVVIAVSLTVFRPILRSAVVSWAWDNPGSLRVGFVADLVKEDLGVALTAPASSDPSEVEFSVRPGDTPVTLAPRLLDEGVIANERAFLFTATEADLAPELEAGRFLLRKDMTPEEVVRGLVENQITVETTNVTFREGLRLEQMTALLQTIPSGVDPQAFYDLATHPPAELLADYPWLEVPEGGSLEGYLYPATYGLVVESNSDANPVTDAEDLVRMLLDEFRDEVGADRMAVPEARGLTFYEVLSLASIVEREAVLDEERPLIAGVYQNRIDGKNKTRLLEADPTVFYGADTVALSELPFEQWQQYLFWAPPGGSLRDVELPEELAGFQTYRNPGLIPAPIATPSVASIDAALAPDTEDDFLYFVAIPDGHGAHDFSKTFAEHQEKLRKYGYAGR